MNCLYSNARICLSLRLDQLLRFFLALPNSRVLNNATEHGNPRKYPVLFESIQLIEKQLLELTKNKQC